MKKQFLIISLFAIAFMAMLTTAVNAADATAKLNGVDSKSVYAGGTLNAIFEVTCESGISGVVATIGYDENKLELVESKLDNRFVNLGEGLKFEVISNVSDTIKSVNLITLSFKVKENAEVGSTKITASDIMIEPESGDSINLQDSEIEYSIIASTPNPDPNPNPDPTPDPAVATLSKIEISAKPTKTSYTEGDKFDKTGMKVTATYSDGTSKEITNYTISPNGELKSTDKKVTVSYTEGSVTKTADIDITVKAKATGGGTKTTDGTEAGKDIPNTGLTTFILPIGISMIIAIVSYIMYKKHNEI